MVSAIILDGFLQKKKKDDKRSFLASKYQRRWFELTSDTLAYAKDAKELKDGGDIEVFAIHELKYVKKLEDDKLEMKFPERILRVKAESHEDHERWYEAIKNARQQKLDGANTPAAKQLENLKMTHTKAMLAESDDEDDNSVVGLGAHPVTPPKRGLPQDLVAKLTQTNTAAPQTPVQSNRPPSPRSLLANPKLGLNIIGTPARSNGAEPRHQQQHQQRQQQEDEEDDDEKGQHIRPVKPRSRWQEEEDEDEAERQRSQPPPQQQQQPQHLLPQHPSSARNGTGSAVGTPRAGAAPASDRLTLNDNAPSPARLGSAGGASKASPADRLTLAEGARPGSGGAGQRGGGAGPNSGEGVGKAAPAQRGEKLALGGDPPGRRPVSSGEGEGARGAVAVGSAGAGAAQGSREEIEDDDWDSSDGEEEKEQEQQPKGKGAAVGRVSGGLQQQQGAGVQGRQGAGTGADTGAGANGVRTSHDRPAVQRPSGGQGGQGQGLAAGSKPGSAGRSQPPPPARHHDDGDEEQDEEEKLAKKHAAGTDHLDDNWDSEEEEDEEEQAPPPRPPPPQQRRPAAPPPAAPQAPPPGPGAGGGRSRIPGLPPQAPASPQRLGILPQKAGVAPPPPSSGAAGGAGGRPRSRLSQGDDDEEEAPRRAGSRPAAAPPQQQQQQQEFKSNVVHDPNVKEDKAWVEEDWDEDD